MAAAPSVTVMALLVMPAGMFIAPLLATRNELIGWVAPAGARTEAYTWPVTAFVGGIAIGSALPGTIVEAASWQLAFVVGAAAAACGALVAFTRRGTLNPRARRRRRLRSADHVRAHPAGLAGVGDDLPPAVALAAGRAHRLAEADRADGRAARALEQLGAA